LTLLLLLLLLLPGFQENLLHACTHWQRCMHAFDQ
jgi:hypothetical protein